MLRKIAEKQFLCVSLNPPLMISLFERNFSDKKDVP